MFGYMTDLNLITEGQGEQEGGKEITVKGNPNNPLDTLVFTFLDEWLYRFHSTGFICTSVEVYSINEVEGTCKTRGKGEVFDMKVHKQGTEVKAITYSNLQVEKKEGRVDVYVIIDI
jgi:SHS2 domain-containing protein